MNWYKKAQRKNRLAELLKGFSMGAIIGLVGWLGFNSMAELQDKYVQDPVSVEQKIVEYQNTSQPQTEIPQSQAQEISQEVSPTIQSGDIDLDKIWSIESSKGTDPKMGESPAGAKGHFQFMEKTWNELVKRMGKNWDWLNGSMDYEKSRQVADYYLNKRIPQMLSYYKIPDTTQTRLTSYDWGIGNLKNIWEENGEDWDLFIPQETKDYFKKYGI